MRELLEHLIRVSTLCRYPLSPACGHARQPAARGRVLAAAAMITLRVRTKDGMERLQVEATATVAAVRELISTQLGVPLEEQVRRQLPAHTLARVCR